MNNNYFWRGFLIVLFTIASIRTVKANDLLVSKPGKKTVVIKEGAKVLIFFDSNESIRSIEGVLLKIGADTITMQRKGGPSEVVSLSSIRELVRTVPKNLVPFAMVPATGLTGGVIHSSSWSTLQRSGAIAVVAVGYFVIFSQLEKVIKRKRSFSKDKGCSFSIR